MRKLLVIFVLCLMNNSFASDKYQGQLRSFLGEINDFGSQIGAFSPNPFQTGTALQGYYLGYKTLLLERDAFFQMKSNKLKTTEHVADFQHRARVLRMHANNMLIQLSKAIKNSESDGFMHSAPDANQQTLEQIIEVCESNSNCVADALAKPETSVYNILLDNFNLASDIFKGIPYMHAIEASSVYLLTQLIYLEVLSSQNKLASVEYNLFAKKQKRLLKKVKKNAYLTPSEKRLEELTIKNTVNKWRKKILVRKNDNREEFRTLSDELRERNQALASELTNLREDNKEVFGKIYSDSRHCRRSLGFFRGRKRCKNRAKVAEFVATIAGGSPIFMDEKEKDLRRKFWRGI